MKKTVVVLMSSIMGVSIGCAAGNIDRLPGTWQAALGKRPPTAVQSQALRITALPGGGYTFNSEPAAA